MNVEQHHPIPLLPGPIVVIQPEPDPASGYVSTPGSSPHASHSHQNGYAQPASFHNSPVHFDRPANIPDVGSLRPSRPGATLIIIPSRRPSSRVSGSDSIPHASLPSSSHLPSQYDEYDQLPSIHELQAPFDYPTNPGTVSQSSSPGELSPASSEASSFDDVSDSHYTSEIQDANFSDLVSEMSTEVGTS